MIGPIPAAAFSVTPSDTTNLSTTVWKVVAEDVRAAESVSTSTDKITYTAHGYSNGDVIKITSAGTTDITVQEYYVVSSATNDFKISTTYGGTAVDIGGTTTTPPSFKRIQKVATQELTGSLYIGTPGDIVVIPASQPNSSTGVTFKNVFGDFALEVKRVFSTGTTATDIVCKHTTVNQ